MILLLSSICIGAVVLFLIFFSTFRNKNFLIKDLKSQISSFEKNADRLEDLLIKNAKQESSILSFKEYIEKLETELSEQKSLYSRTNESLYKAKQELELKNQEMREFRTRVNDWEKSRTEAITQAKAAIFETASTLSKELIESHKKETKDSEAKLSANTAKLQEQFEKIVNNVGVLNNEIKTSKESVDTVKRALLTPSGAGNLAEITLENILKTSGLQPNTDFIMQYSFTAKTSEKIMLRPDAVVFLPGDNLMIIDSKSSKYFSEIIDSEEQGNSKEIHAKLKGTMRQHLKNLKGKNYKDFLKEDLSDKKINHISSIMFLPTEVALEKISKIDKDFIHTAWENDIFPVGPSGLINLLLYAKFQISAQTQSENQQLIVEEVRKLLNSITHLYEHTRKLGNSLHSTTNHFDKLASSFNANFLPKARNLEKLGVNIQKNKSIPHSLDRLTVVSSKKMEIIDVEQEPTKKLQEQEETDA
ncbi:MAG: DNA recombination protein RmuC [Alphaproteobacteria bacterium]|nr:DNA recombination protein RmuC [Alphaproteobacteria bacterium]